MRNTAKKKKDSCVCLSQRSRRIGTSAPHVCIYNSGQYVRLNCKNVCCYDKKSKVGRNSLEETILTSLCAEQRAREEPTPPQL